MGGFKQDIPRAQERPEPPLHVSTQNTSLNVENCHNMFIKHFFVISHNIQKKKKKITIQAKLLEK